MSSGNEWREGPSLSSVQKGERSMAKDPAWSMEVNEEAAATSGRAPVWVTQAGEEENNARSD